MGYRLGNFFASKEGDWNNTVLGGVSEDRTHNDVHEMLTRGGNPLTTDAKGNITVNSNSQRYTWDADNMMSAADINGDLTPDVQYVMDAGFRRIAKIANGVTTVFAYAGWQCVEEFDATSTLVALRKFAFGVYLDEPLMMASVSGAAETLHFYHQNANYNVIALTDASGAIADRIVYSSYGQIVMVTNGSTGNPWFFTGQRHDSDTGLDYYKRRYYDSSLGRFATRDPIEFDRSNLYAYVRNNPLVKIDPRGLQIRDGEKCKTPDVITTLEEAAAKSILGNNFLGQILADYLHDELSKLPPGTFSGDYMFTGCEWKDASQKCFCIGDKKCKYECKLTVTIEIKLPDSYPMRFRWEKEKMPVCTKNLIFCAKSDDADACEGVSMEKQYLGNLFPADFSKVEGSLVADPNPKVVESEDEKKKREEADKTFRKQVKELGDTIEAGKKKVEEMGKTIEKGKQ